MSNPGQQQNRMNSQDVAYMVRALKETGHVSFDLDPLPNGCSPTLTIKKIKSNWLMGSKPVFRLIVDPVDGVAPCKECRRQIERLAYGASVENLVPMLSHVRSILLECPKCGRANRNVDQQALLTPTDTDHPRVRVTPDSQENRIKVLTSDVATESVGPATPAVPSPKLIKLKKSNVKVSTETSENQDRFRAPRTAASHIYGAPSIRYAISGGSAIEVTLPRHICEEIVEYSKQSRRTRREVGGILVGYSRETERPRGRFFQVTATDIIRVESSDSSIAHLTLNEDTWAKIQRIFEAKYAGEGKVRLGWFHTHPIQGIFFSPQDKDTHTVFTLPYQFALVVDPRAMWAGLFAWEDVEYRVLLESNLFPLQLQSETANRVQESEIEGSNQESPPYSMWRIVFFSMLAVAVIVYVTLNASLPIDPTYAIVLALTVFLGLRLWNANFFNPASVVELDLIRKLVEGLAAPDEYVVGSRSEPRSVVNAVLFIACVIVIFAFGYLMAVWMNEPVPTAMNSTPPVTPNQIVSPNVQERKLVLSLLGGKDTLDMTSKNPNAEVRYIQQRQPLQWQPAQEEQERKFFSAVFHVDLTSRNKYFSNLQEVLNPDDKKKDRADRWTDELRNSLLLRFKQLKESKTQMEMPVPDGKRISLRVE